MRIRAYQNLILILSLLAITVVFSKQSGFTVCLEQQCSQEVENCNFNQDCQSMRSQEELCWKQQCGLTQQTLSNANIQTCRDTHCLPKNFNPHYERLIDCKKFCTNKNQNTNTEHSFMKRSWCLNVFCRIQVIQCNLEEDCELAQIQEEFCFSKYCPNLPENKENYQICRSKCKHQINYNKAWEQTSICLFNCFDLIENIESGDQKASQELMNQEHL